MEFPQITAAFSRAADTYATVKPCHGFTGSILHVISRQGAKAAKEMKNKVLAVVICNSLLLRAFAGDCSSLQASPFCKGGLRGLLVKPNLP
jgi:hypothetical protein